MADSGVGSNSSANPCGDGPWRLDNFILFTPNGCMHQPLHYALICIWFIVFVYGLIEFLLEAVFRTNKVFVGNQYQQAIGFFFHLTGHICFCLIILIDPYASITNRTQGLAMMICLAVASSGFMTTFCGLSQGFITITTNALAVSSSKLEIQGQEIPTFHILRIFLLILPVFICVSITLFWVILPFSFTDPNLRQLFLDIGCIILGVATLTLGVFVANSTWQIRIFCFNQVKFLRELAGDHQVGIDQLSTLGKTAQGISVSNVFNSGFCAIFFIVVGSYVTTRWWFLHVMDGPGLLVNFAAIQLFGGSTIWRLLRGRVLSSRSTSPDSSESSNTTTKQKTRLPSETTHVPAPL